ncbi:MAG: hypothetical protein ABR924_18575 [Terracidiphilus sp.]|jgi:hypothetical protein
MRSAADIITVQATVTRRLSIDLERLEKDPVWNQILEQGQTEPTPVSLEEAMKRYLQYYIVRDQFPHQTPCTNGPGDIDFYLLEVKWPQ